MAPVGTEKKVVQGSMEAMSDTTEKTRPPSGGAPVSNRCGQGLETPFSGCSTGCPVPLVEVSRCRRAGGTFLEREGRELAVFLLGDPPRAVVIDNACPHAGGNLSAGRVDGGVVTCPWHEWRFDLEQGVCTHSPLARVVRYRSEIRDGVVWAELGMANGE